VEASQDLDADALAYQVRGLATDGGLEQHEECLDFFVGASPVLARERVDRQSLEAAVGGMLDDGADRVDAGGMALRL